MSAGKFARSMQLLILLGTAGRWFIPVSDAAEIVRREQYLEYARASAEYTWRHYDEIIATWKQNFNPENVFGYRPPGGLLEMAVIYSELYKRDRNPEYLVPVKKVLLTYGEFRSIYPHSIARKRYDYADGVPALPDFFTTARYIRAYDNVKASGGFSEQEKRKIERTIAESMNYLLRTQEWGPMNRAALRAETLAWAVRAIPDHPRARIWEMQRKALGDDNWGNWEIEDATLYHGVWLYALIGYARALGKLDDLFKTPEIYYYAHYFLHLMSPLSMIPDFGDANLYSSWNRFLVFFETAASQYKDANMKWAANRIAKKFIDFTRPQNVGLGLMLLDCYLLADDRLSPIPPANQSEEVMEDVQGKKIVFRNGWSKEATYLLLNYRDEGDGGRNFRDYLRDTIPVEEEKMTHGHSDENSIVMLVSGGSLLLHDGGYRDFMPSGPFGAYRQDYFHNRLCVRNEKIAMGQKPGQFRYSIRQAVPGQSVLEFLRNAGSYRPIRTQKVDFLSMSDFDYSRTRVIDRDLGYQWDRVITYVKTPELFVVFDIFKALKEDYFTLANLWHTRKIVSHEKHWYETVYDSLGNQAFPQEKHLLILFPRTHFRLEGVEQQKRYYQNEWLIHQTTAQHFELGETVGFLTVLVPLSPPDSPVQWAARIKEIPAHPRKAAMAVQIYSSDRELIVAVKNDLRMDMVRDWRRPKYTYAAGKIQFADFETNGDFLFATQRKNKLHYTIVNLTRAFYRGKILFAAKPSIFGLSFDGTSDKPGTGKLRYWRDQVTLKNEQENR